MNAFIPEDTPVVPVESMGSIKKHSQEELSLSDEIRRISVLIEELYDIVPAGFLIDSLRSQVSSDKSDEWKEFIGSELYKLYARRLRFYHLVGETCCSQKDTWFSIFSNAAGTQTIHAYLDPKDRTNLQYRVRAVIPAKLTSVILVANEVQFMQEWNKLVVKQPVVIGRRTAHYVVLNYQVSVLAGMFKVDILSEIRRFTNAEGGFLAEYISSVEEGNEHYRPPASGYKRSKTKIRNIWAACGPDHTVLTQVGQLRLPFSVNEWVVSKVGALAGNKIIGGLVNNCLLANKPGNMWEKDLAADSSGLYRRLDECAASGASVSRAPSASSPSVAPFDLSDYFLSPMQIDGQTAQVDP
jgi:hypothetical protein